MKDWSESLAVLISLGMRFEPPLALEIFQAINEFDLLAGCSPDQAEIISSPLTASGVGAKSSWQKRIGKGGYLFLASCIPSHC